MKFPIFFLDDDTDTGNRAVGTAADREAAEANLHAEIQGALDRLERGEDGCRVTLVLTRRDMTAEELDSLPEE